VVADSTSLANANAVADAADNTTSLENATAIQIWNVPVLVILTTITFIEGTVANTNIATGVTDVDSAVAASARHR